MTKEYIFQWILTHCKTKEVLDTLRNRAEKNANDILFSKLEHNEITATPLVFDSTEFESLQAFGIAMFKASDMYMNSEDIMVRYSKPENKETKEINIQFSILKSKAKIFYKYMVSNKEKTFECVLGTSGKRIQEAMKFFQKLGVKGWDGQSLKDCTQEVKEVITTSQNPYYVAVSFDNENGDVILEFDIVDANKSYKTFDDVKKEIEEILNI